tara:strand:+ start:424 stop:1278 length:855 start_codon:yes stop_codon:yes gene_type:complete
MKHIISIDDLNKKEIFSLFKSAKRIQWAPWLVRNHLNHKILANLFYEPSTRTSSSFAAAMYNLGGNVISINDVNYSSVAKGENLEDTIITMACYADIIVLRTKNIGDARRAAELNQCPIINAGDGSGEHPTQTLLDLYTIYLEKKTIEGLNITFAGDIRNSRTIHSLSKVLEKYNNTCNYCETYEDMIPYIKESDVLYMTRVQRERGSTGNYELTKDHVLHLNKNCIVLHPFPRNNEIPRWFDNDNRAKYFIQMKNGLYIRMALLLAYKKGTSSIIEEVFHSYK